jgi:cysteine desulfurase
MKLADGTLYFDCNATTPEAPEVTEVVCRVAREGFANPSSLHEPGRKAKAFLEEARSKVAELVGCAPTEVIFTGSATEANHLAILSAEKASGSRRRLIVSAIEHPSVLAAAEKLAGHGFDVAEAPVAGQGAVDLDALESLLSNGGVALVSVMAAHNETGVLQPVEEIGALCRKHGALFHTDAVQAMGKVPSCWSSARPDYLTLAAHKLYGPKGIAALVVRPGAPLVPQLTGGGQECGRRSSTEAVHLAAGFGVACRMAQENLGQFACLAKLRDGLEDGVLRRLGAQVFGAEARRIPNTSFFCLPGLSGGLLAEKLDELGIFVGTGSACHEGAQGLPRVLQCMGALLPSGSSPLRVSLGRYSSAGQVETLAHVLYEEATR